MTEEQALEYVKEALAVAKGASVGFEAEEDLVASGVLDSLDSMVFLMEVEKVSGKEIPSGSDPRDLGLLTPSILIEWLTK